MNKKETIIKLHLQNKNYQEIEDVVNILFEEGEYVNYEV